MNIIKLSMGKDQRKSSFISTESALSTSRDLLMSWENETCRIYCTAPQTHGGAAPNLPVPPAPCVLGPKLAGQCVWNCNTLGSLKHAVSCDLWQQMTESLNTAKLWPVFIYFYYVNSPWLWVITV